MKRMEDPKQQGWGTHRELLAININGMRIKQPAPAFMVVYLVAIQDFHVHAIQALKLFALVLLEALPGDARWCDIPAAAVQARAQYYLSKLLSAATQMQSSDLRVRDSLSNVSEDRPWFHTG